MRFSSRQAKRRKRRSVGWMRYVLVISMVAALAVQGYSQNGWSMQHDQLAAAGPGGQGDAGAGQQSNPDHGAPAGQNAPGAGAQMDRKAAQGRDQKGNAHVPAPPAHGSEFSEEHGPVAEHGAATRGAGGHGPALPEISSIPGVTFVDTMIRLMDYELNGRFLGWRPNDIIVGRFTDNINNYQLGVLEAMRFTCLRLKDSLTRMGDADAYDSDLEQALNLFMNKATSFWFPSAESSYNEALDHLKRFRNKLEAGQRGFYYRIDNLLSLINAYKDLLGNVNRSLIMANHNDGSPISWFETDDYYYYAQGVGHVMYEVLRVVRVGYKDQLVTINAIDIMDEIIHELHRCEEMSPWIIMDGDLDGFYANHRANLNAPLSEVTHLLSVISRF